MRVLITGASGQLGWALRRAAPKDAAVAAFSRQELDIADAPAVARAVTDFGPEVILNAAAFTAVDRAETEPEAAFAVNAVGAGNVARAAAAGGAFLVHVSTDFVFDGAAVRPYPPDAGTNPLGVYGTSKVAGEERVRQEAGETSLILRSSWLYGSQGHNFVKTMLRVMGERDQVKVVADQMGAPTWTRSLADAIWAAAAEKLTGVHHWSDAGVASWYDFAVAIQEKALEIGLLRRRVPVHAIASEDYPTAARRPRYSVLDTSALRDALGVSPRHWQISLGDMLKELKEQVGCGDSLSRAAQGS